MVARMVARQLGRRQMTWKLRCDAHANKRRGKRSNRRGRSVPRRRWKGRRVSRMCRRVHFLVARWRRWRRVCSIHECPAVRSKCSVAQSSFELWRRPRGDRGGTKCACIGPIYRIFATLGALCVTWATGAYQFLLRIFLRVPRSREGWHVTPTGWWLVQK